MIILLKKRFLTKLHHPGSLIIFLNRHRTLFLLPISFRDLPCFRLTIGRIAFELYFGQFGILEEFGHVFFKLFVYF